MGEVADQPPLSRVASCAGRGKERLPAGHSHLPPIGTGLQHPASSVPLPPSREGWVEVEAEQEGRDRDGWRRKSKQSCSSRLHRREMKTRARATMLGLRRYGLLGARGLGQTTYDSSFLFLFSFPFFFIIYILL